ncbi:MAG: hypothetical protein AAFX99_28965 [Myxococcota bacterium]
MWYRTVWIGWWVVMLVGCGTSDGSDGGSASNSVMDGGNLTTGDAGYQDTLVTADVTPDDDTNTPEEDTQAPNEDTSSPEEDTQVPEEDTQVPNEDTSSPEEDTQAPEEDTQVPEEDTQVPEEDTQVPEEDTGVPDEDTSMPGDTSAPEEDTQVPNEDAHVPEEDTHVPDEDTARPEPDPLLALSDEFSDSGSLAAWSRVFEVEQWDVDQLETFAVEQGHLVMIPYTSSWYQDYRGVLAFKEVTGDFVATAHVQVSNRAQTGAPGVSFSLAGIMVRTPRQITAETWVPGEENYIFLSLGAADTAGSYQTEVKTTIDSDSRLEIGSGMPEATIRVARVGEHVILLIRYPGQGWAIHRRYTRSDMPETLQVGFTTYTDWPTCSGYEPREHNNTRINGNPDLMARFDYMRWMRPPVPESLLGAALSNPNAVSDAQLLAFLGEALDGAP